MSSSKIANIDHGLAQAVLDNTISHTHNEQKEESRDVRMIRIATEVVKNLMAVKGEPDVNLRVVFT